MVLSPMKPESSPRFIVPARHTEDGERVRKLCGRHNQNGLQLFIIHIFRLFSSSSPPPARSTCVHFQFAWWCRTHHALGTLGKYFRRWGVTTGTNVINPICTSRSRPNFFSLFFFPFLSSRPTRSTIQLKVLSLFQNMQLATQLMASVPKSCGTTLTRIHAAVITNTLSITCR